MNLHKKTHRILLIISFVYLTMCPFPHMVWPEMYEHVVSGMAVKAPDVKQQRGHGIRADLQLFYFPVPFIASPSQESPVKEGTHYSNLIETVPSPLSILFITRLLL